MRMRVRLLVAMTLAVAGLVGAGLFEHQIDTESVNKLIDEKYKIKVAKTKSLVDQFAKLKAVLSEDQYDKMKEVWREQKK